MTAAQPANEALIAWVDSIAKYTTPESVHWCDGSDAELAELRSRMVEAGTLIPLNEATHPGSFLHRSDPSDVARTEQLTFICTTSQDDAGPTNNWMRPEDADSKVWPHFKGCMAGRTMYVVPYLMGPAGSPYSRVGVQLTDSPYVVANLGIMTRMGRVALQHLGSSAKFVRGIHSLGDLSPERRYIVHFPAVSTIWSIGSGYGGNALLSKKCHALRIASAQGCDEGWLAEHMMIVGVTNPRGVTRYIAAAFPSGCGKTNLAMLAPSLPGWTVETVGDDICWMHVGNDGRLWAINPEAGLFGVAPGTSMKTNPNAMRTLTHDVIFTNVALRSDRTPWWEGKEPLSSDEVLEDWQGRPWTTQSLTPAAHPNSRFTAALAQCPSATKAHNGPLAVPISAIVFGGRRAKVAPLVYEARSWRHGVYVGATMVSETTAAAVGEVGVPRNDPMAMLPFCGYNMADYFHHWLNVGKSLKNPPKIFHVNWFRTSSTGKYLWPGFGENIRVLQWILGRVEGNTGALETPIGFIPSYGSLDLTGIDLSTRNLHLLMKVNRGEWLTEARRNREFLARFGDRLPRAILSEHRRLVRRLTVQKPEGARAGDAVDVASHAAATDEA
jgi:phosphoenolpyruvate carboxykinase (GTP)